MNAIELKRMLDIVVRRIEDIVRHDDINSDVISVDSEWSEIDDIREHLEFLKDQVTGLKDAVKDKSQ